MMGLKYLSVGSEREQGQAYFFGVSTGTESTANLN
jgi:hypothetical protein